MFGQLFNSGDESTIEISREELERNAELEGEPGNEDNSEEPEPVNGFRETWGWIAITNELANGDLTKWNYFDDIPVIEFLNLVCFLRDKRNYDNDLNEKNVK